MLEQHNFFADRSWIVEKVVFVYLLDGGAIVNFVTHSIYVDKMKQVGWGDYLGAVIKKHAEGPIWQFVSETVLRTEINKLHN